MLFDVERNLEIAGRTAHRADEPDGRQCREDREDRDAEPDDRRGAETRDLQPPRRQHQRQQAAANDDDRAPQEQAGTPPLADLPNDVDQFLTLRPAAQCLGHGA